jgi:SAM-dependent methyltransferase
VTLDDPWLASTWPFVRSQLPSAPGAVLDLGCGPRGGFVPALIDAGYDGLGVDPAAPDGAHYHQVAFEQLDLAGQFGAVVASTSLHHVEDIDHVSARIADALRPGGVLVVLEWAWERFDEPTAQWCFSRLAPPTESDHPRWLHRHRDEWIESGKPWEAYFNGWVTDHGLHPGHAIIRALDTRFERRLLTEGPYFFADLDHTSEADEQAVVDAGLIRPTGLRYAATAPETQHPA